MINDLNKYAFMPCEYKCKFVLNINNLIYFWIF